MIAAPVAPRRRARLLWYAGIWRCAKRTAASTHAKPIAPEGERTIGEGCEGKTKVRPIKALIAEPCPTLGFHNMDHSTCSLSLRRVLSSLPIERFCREV